MPEELFGKATFTTDDLGEGGGLHDDVDGTIIAAKFELEEWKDKNGTPHGNPSVVCSISRQFDDGTADMYPTKYVVGTPDYWKIAPDGLSLFKAKSESSKFNKKYGFGKFVEKVIGIGAAALLADGTIAGLTGQAFHWLNEPDIDKDGKEKKNEKGYAVTTPFPSRYIGKAAGQPQANKPTPAGVKSADTMIGALREFVVNTAVEGAKTPADLFKLASKDPGLKAAIPLALIMKMLQSPDLLATGELSNVEGKIGLAG